MKDLRVGFARGRRCSASPVQHAIDWRALDNSTVAVCGMPVDSGFLKFDPSHPRACRDCAAGRLGYDRRPIR